MKSRTGLAGDTTPSLTEAIGTDLLALWRDAEVTEAIMVGRENALRRRLSDPHRPVAPSIAHETRDDLLRHPSAAATALGARAPEPPEPVGEALERVAENGKGKGLFANRFRLAARTIDDAAPFRARVAYRIVREHARLKNLITDDESLIEALGIDPNQPGDPWRGDTSFVPPTRRDGTTRLTMPAWHALEALQEQPLLPPVVSREFRDVGDGPGAKGDLTILRSYSPERDRKYLDWIEGADMIVRYLKIRDGSEADREQGIVGLQGMLDPDRARLLWPSRYEIAAFEAVLIEETLGEMIESGVPGAVKFLGVQYGLSRREAGALVKLAKAQARESMESDTEDNRALMVLRLESYLGRAKGALNLQAEMYALKLMALVQGLGKSKPEDIAQDFIDVVTRVAERRNAEAILPGDEKELEALPPSTGADADFSAARASHTIQESS